VRLFVTGLAGYLGSHLAVVATAAGWEVAGTVHAALAPDHRWRALSLDVRDRAAVVRAVAAVAPDAVVHTAYRMGDDERARSVNVDGAAAVAAGAAAAGARLVHLSTDVVFSGRQGRPLTEDDPPDPVTGYGQSKAQAEAAVVAEHPEALLVRTSLLYGGRRPGTHEAMALAVARGGRDQAFFTDEVRCPIEVGDLAAAVLELCELDVTGPLHVAGADVLSRLDFARLVCAHRGRDPAALRGAPAGPDRPKHLVLDSGRARALLRVRLRGAREVLA